MNPTLLFSTLLVTVSLVACDRPATVITVPGPTVSVPGPAGPAGATGSQGETGYQGNTGATGSQGNEGKTGGNTTVIVMPPASAPTN
jgi:hypothetical protein